MKGRTPRRTALFVASPSAPGEYRNIVASSFDLYRQQLLNFPELGVSLDFSRAPAPAGFAEKMAPAIARAFADMAALEKGAVANPDEKRMVGHYWLRTPELAPDAKIAADVKAAVEAIAGFAAHAVAVTGEGSQLDKVAVTEKWLARFPMWDWVGGRTSEIGPVGLLPAALQGLDIHGLLAGAREMDALTRVPDAARNPAAAMALAWHHLTEGRGSKAMVVLPYKDRLLLFSRYLQQLVMESLGKEHDLQGRQVFQGLTVYGNKGSTDQHAYVQQLRDGVNNFFAVFIEVLKDREGASPEVEPGVTSGDYLQAFLLGTREALSGSGRANITITLQQVDARAIGMLIALFERAVGLYANLLGINAYHQPGVEAGKKAASETLKIRAAALAALAKSKGKWLSARQVCEEIALEGQEELVFKVLLHVSANPGAITRQDSPDPGLTLFRHS